jgi:hypothetical protein
MRRNSHARASNGNTPVLDGGEGGLVSANGASVIGASASTMLADVRALVVVDGAAREGHVLSPRLRRRRLAHRGLGDKCSSFEEMKKDPLGVAMATMKSSAHQSDDIVDGFQRVVVRRHVD